MLSWFEIENFKSIKRLRLDLTPFMVLVGPNGAGKTNILQALALFLDILRIRTTEPIETYGGYDQLIRRGKRPARNMRFSMGFPITTTVNRQRNIKRQFVIELGLTLAQSARDPGVRITEEQLRIVENGQQLVLCQWRNQSLELVDPAPTAETHDKWMDEFRYLHFSPGPLKFGQQVGSIDIVSFLSDDGMYATPAVKRIRLDASALRMDIMASTPRRFPFGATGEGLPLAIERLRPRGKAPTEAFQRVLRALQSVYPRIDDVSTVHYQPGRVALSFRERGIDANLGEASVSDGVIHALGLLIALSDNGENLLQPPPLLAIEEPENALHPWALQKILEEAQDRLPRKEPLLISTHSPVVVDTVRDPASLFIVENDDKRGTIVTPALEKEKALRAILADSGQKLGDVWLNGTLGGVPGTDP